MRIVFSSNISWSIYNFRTPLLKELQRGGYEIYTVASEDSYSKKLIDNKFQFIHIDVVNNNTNPVKDLWLIWNYYKVYKNIKPAVICHNAIKPNIYGTIAASLLGIPTVNNISGLGTLFIKKSYATRIAKFLYKVSQSRASWVFFQNQDDKDLFVSNKLIKEGKTHLIPGSGVNTNYYKPNSNKSINKSFEFLFIGRLLNDKGIREFVNAAREIIRKHSNVSFNILGPFYLQNDTAVTEQEMDGWVKSGFVNYLGETDDVKSYMEKTDCVVLPSYREGLSKVLIEASSVAVPIITTNVPGCRDVVIDNKTGFLCEERNSKDLALKMEKMLLLPEAERYLLGQNGRKRAIEVFDEKIIISHYIKAIKSVVKS